MILRDLFCGERWIAAKKNRNGLPFSLQRADSRMAVPLRKSHRSEVLVQLHIPRTHAIVMETIQMVGVHPNPILFTPQ
jgi:hypothetical protein